MPNALEEDRMACGLLHMKARLRTWYSKQHRLYPHELQSKVDDLSLTMLGSESEPYLHAKGGETRGMIGFALTELMLHMDKLRDQAIAQDLFEAGGNLKA
eukprot:573817-Pyramimonas_sp.AAC.1